VSSARAREFLARLQTAHPAQITGIASPGGIVELKIMSLNTRYGGRINADGRPEGRWPLLADLIADIDPHVLLLQELVGWRGDPRLQAAAEKDLADRDCPIRFKVAPSGTDSHTAVGRRTDALDWRQFETKYSDKVENGYGVAVLLPHDAPDQAPGLTVISAHLTAYSTDAAAHEAQRMIGRLYRYGGIGVLGGDINHMPVGDPEPDWDAVQPYNRSSRCLPRHLPDDPWEGNRAVGHVLANGGLIDVAAHLARTRQQAELRAPTAPGGIRVDQIHVTGNLTDAITDYKTYSAASDHDAIVATLNLAQAGAPTPWI
jgi:endonuclease/exonuclease/phosphatase family metal-dependent hydrolase